MSFVYFVIWQIRNNEPKDFEKATIGFGKDIENTLTKADSPFAFSTVNERSILRFLKLIQCDNSKIGTYSKLVDDRNDTAHANGHIFYNDRGALDAKIGEVLRVANEIHTHSTTVVLHCYKDFLLQSYDEEEREYSDATDQIREVLIHSNYMSQKDIEVCVAFDIAALQQQTGFSQIETLHKSLCEAFGTED